jgi:hypothetical protein
MESFSGKYTLLINVNSETQSCNATEKYCNAQTDNQSNSTETSTRKSIAEVTVMARNRPQAGWLRYMAAPTSPATNVSR